MKKILPIVFSLSLAIVLPQLAMNVVSAANTANYCQVCGDVTPEPYCKSCAQVIKQSAEESPAPKRRARCASAASAASVSSPPAAPDADVPRPPDFIVYYKSKFKPCAECLFPDNPKDARYCVFCEEEFQ
jgi:hypothetical protein